MALMFWTATTMAVAGPKPTPRKPAQPKAPTYAPAGPLPFLPSIGRVFLDVRDEAVVATEDVLLPQGDYKRGTLRLFTAFGGPGVPLAVDARLLPVAPEALEAPLTESGDKLSVELAPRAPTSANVLLGPSTMAGVVVMVPEGALLRAFSPGRMAVLRLRLLYALPTQESDGMRTVVLRVGSHEREPLTLGLVHVENASAARAHFCGTNSEVRPLSVWHARGRYASEAPTIAPVMAVRQRDEALCVSFKAKSAKP